MENRPTDMGAGKGVKGGLPLLAVELGCSQQPKQTHLHEIVEGLGATQVVVKGDRPHELLVLLDAGIALLQRPRQTTLVAAGCRRGLVDDGAGHDGGTGAKPCSFFSKQLQEGCPPQP
jgi:hypothetical protein